MLQRSHNDVVRSHNDVVRSHNDVVRSHNDVIRNLLVLFLIVLLLPIIVNPAHPDSQYILHVQTPIGEFVTISYSGDYVGSNSTPFTIGPKSAPFTVTLTAPSKYVDQVLEGWILDGVSMGNSNTSTVTVNENHSERVAAAGYVTNFAVVEWVSFSSTPIIDVPMNSGATYYTPFYRTGVPLGVHASVTAPLTYRGYTFNGWLADGLWIPTPSISLYAIGVNESRSATAYYSLITPPSAQTRPVGGVVEPVNKLTLFTPYLAVFGVVAAVAVVIVTDRKRRELTNSQ